MSANDHAPRILLADDNADMRDYVRRLLSGSYRIDVVADGMAALEAIRGHRPDLLLTDIMMPRLDGFGLIRAMREDEELRDLPIIALSAKAGDEAKVEGLEVGADDYLVKPFSAREVVAIVHSTLELTKVRRETVASLRESEARFRNMADHAPVMMWVTDAEAYCTYLNRGWYEFTGQTEETGLGYGWLDATHPDDKAFAEKAFLAANEKQEAFRIEYRLRRADWQYRCPPRRQERCQAWRRRSRRPQEAVAADGRGRRRASEVCHGRRLSRAVILTRRPWTCSSLRTTSSPSRPTDRLPREGRRPPISGRRLESPHGCDRIGHSPAGHGGNNMSGQERPRATGIVSLVQTRWCLRGDFRCHPTPTSSPLRVNGFRRRAANPEASRA